MNLRINFVLLFVVLICRFTYTSSRFRIVGGNSSNISDSPYMVSLHYGNTGITIFFCAGSLVTMQIVVTAAHCLGDRSANLITVVAGVADIRQTGQRREVERTFQACNYNFMTYDMDIGAIKVRTPFIQSPAVNAIPLCSTKLKPGTQMQISGWGKTNENEQDYQDVLRTTVVPIVPQRDCARSYKSVNQIIYKSMICAGLGGTGSCEGDSGGPGVVNGKLCAVTSLSVGCARPAFPGIYINVNNKKVLSFIKKLMKL
ncbi:seminase-like [Eurosta solidaginis]|uniref:seminase-like n=1 Tax=Eurosta solidaginis TaxID=178769 RepID=UPI003531059E